MGIEEGVNKIYNDNYERDKFFNSSGLSISIADLSVFIITKIFPMLQRRLGQHGTYWLLGSVALCSNAFFYFFVPETKGKSFVEIQLLFGKSMEQ